MNNPIYDAVVADLNFDPAALSPIQHETERHLAHKVWAEKTWRKIRSASAGTLARQRAKGAA